MDWYVVHTKPKQEFRAQENLQNQGFETYLPTIKKQYVRGQKIDLKSTPLFSKISFYKARSSSK
jgi:transcriptional antiterminator RfaH